MQPPPDVLPRFPAVAWAGRRRRCWESRTLRREGTGEHRSLTIDRSKEQVVAEPEGRVAPGDREALLRLARESLCDYLRDGRRSECRTDSPALLQPGAAFVTLWVRGSGELRGCRGEIPARRPLIEAVANLVISSAVDDSRFSPVQLEEVPNLRIEISVLTPPKRIRPEEVVVGRHGLMITSDDGSGLLLPDVAVRHGWGREEFLGAVCSKAMLPETAWKRGDVELHAFETEAWGEEA